jgi:hypothetical protein
MASPPQFIVFRNPWFPAVDKAFRSVPSQEENSLRMYDSGGRLTTGNKINSFLWLRQVSFISKYTYRVREIPPISSAIYSRWRRLSSTTWGRRNVYFRCRNDVNITISLWAYTTFGAPLAENREYYRRSCNNNEWVPLFPPWDGGWPNTQWQYRTVDAAKWVSSVIRRWRIPWFPSSNQSNPNSRANIQLRFPGPRLEHLQLSELLKVPPLICFVEFGLSYRNQ